MGFFRSASKLGGAIKTKLGDEDFRDKLNGIGSILQGDDKAYETYSKRKMQRTTADSVADAMANGQTPVAEDEAAFQGELGTVRVPSPQQLAARLYGRPNLPMMSKAQPTFLRRF